MSRIKFAYKTQANYVLMRVRPDLAFDTTIAFIDACVLFIEQDHEREACNLLRGIISEDQIDRVIAPLMKGLVEPGRQELRET